MRGPVLGIVAGILAIAALGVYVWPLLFSKGPESPEELAGAALSAGTADLREGAAVRLSQLGKPAREQMLRVLGESQQPEVRVACIRGLAEQWSYRSMTVLLDAVDDESPLVRAQAGAAVENMLREEYGFRADDPPEARREAVQRLRSGWEKFQRSNMGQAFMRQQDGDDL